MKFDHDSEFLNFDDEYPPINPGPRRLGQAGWTHGGRSRCPSLARTCRRSSSRTPPTTSGHTRYTLLDEKGITLKLSGDEVYYTHPIRFRTAKGSLDICMHIYTHIYIHMYVYLSIYMTGGRSRCPSLDRTCRRPSSRTPPTTSGHTRYTTLPDTGFIRRGLPFGRGCQKSIPPQGSGFQHWRSPLKAL